MITRQSIWTPGSARQTSVRARRTGRVHARSRRQAGLIIDAKHLGLKQGVARKASRTSKGTHVGRKEFSASLPDGARAGQERGMVVSATDTLIRAARELLRWDQKTLAQRAGVGLATLRRFEAGDEISDDRMTAIVDALQAAGVAFLGPKTGKIAVKEGVALTPAGVPLERPPKRVHRPHRRKADTQA